MNCDWVFEDGKWMWWGTYAIGEVTPRVRVLRAKYGPHEKSVMHEHPASVAVFMSDGQAKFTLPDGTSQDSSMKLHDAVWADAGKHLPENVGDTPFEVIVIELKK